MQIGEGIAGRETADGGGLPSDNRLGARLRFVEIRGLYRPGVDDSVQRGDGRAIRCGYQVGYTSQDDRGRIFVNHRPRTDAATDWQTTHAKDTQYVEMIVEAVGTTGAIPGSARIEWTWTDPDDGSDASLHSAGAQHIDPNGSAGDDNRGFCDFPGRNASHRPTFQSVSGYSMSGSGTTVQTTIANNRSSVRLHVTNVGGDNVRVVARLIGGPAGVADVHTGIMTTWKRIDVEYHRMRGVFALMTEEAARAFEPAFVQLDFTAEHEIPHERAVSTTDDLGGPAGALVQRVFTHAGQPGWFATVAADLETSLVSSSPRQVAYPAGPAQLVAFAAQGSGPNSRPAEQWVVLPRLLTDAQGNAAEAGAVKLVHGSDRLTLWTSGTAHGWPSPTQTGIQLQPLRYYNVVDPEHGSIERAHSQPNDYVPMPQAGFQNLGFSADIQCEVEIGFAIGASGINPLIQRGRYHYLCGRMVVFMGRFTNREESLQTTVHELCHAFGFAHSCGRTAARSGSGQACTMAILNHWVFRPGTGSLERWSHPPRGTELCEYHLRGLRQTHLEDNPALWNW